MKPLLLFLLLSGCAKPNFSAVPKPAPPAQAREHEGSVEKRSFLVGADILAILPPTNVFRVRTNTWITVGPGVEKITNGNLVLSVTVDRITRIQRVPVLYSNGVRIGVRK